MRLVTKSEVGYTIVPHKATIILLKVLRTEYYTANTVNSMDTVVGCV